MPHARDTLDSEQYQDGLADSMDDEPRKCEHVDEREIAGGWLECVDCGRLSPA